MLRAGLTEAVRAGQQRQKVEKQQTELAQHAQHSSHKSLQHSLDSRQGLAIATSSRA